MTSFIIMQSLGSFLAGIPGAYIALFGTIFGGVGLRVAEHLLNRDAATSNKRRNFTDEIDGLVKRIDGLEEEITLWRNRYYAEQEENAGLRVTMVNNGLTPPAKRTEAP